MKILIATPAYGEQVHTAYHLAVMKTLMFFKDEFPGISFESRLMTMSILPRVRNVFASLVLEDPSFSHLLFIDSDMGFYPELIAKMLAFQKPVVGVIAPKKKIDYDAFYRGAVVQGKDGSVLLTRLLAAEYIGGGDNLITTIGPDGVPTVEIVDGFVRTEAAGTGIMLIAREALETMKERFPELYVPGAGMNDVGLKGGLFQCFDSVPTPGSLTLGEDLAFCRRWVGGCGGEIWANVDQAILHVGTHTYVGQYDHKLQLKLERMASAHRARTLTAA